MKLIIAGSRDLYPGTELISGLIALFKIDNITEIVSGKAPGVDASGEAYAGFMHIPVIEFPADWETYGKAAGPLRNQAMSEYADALLIIHHNSKGSLNMIWNMKSANKPVFEVILKK